MDKSPVVEKIPLVLITGFLGSGKTSLLKHILSEIGSENRIAVVQNEFAPGRVDSTELESTGVHFDLLEINNGSVFCACLLDSFIDQLGEFINTYKPEAIFLEATGLADPISLAQVMQAKEVQNHLFLGGVWTVVDCVNFNRSHKYVQRVRHQIQIADIILLNKSDIVYPGKELEDQISEWNPHAKQYVSSGGWFPDIGKGLLSALSPSGPRSVDIKNLQHTDSLPVPDIGSCVIRTQKKFSEESIRRFHSDHKELIFRMKGYVKIKNDNYLLIQTVFDQLVFEATENWKGPSEIIIMGPGIKPGPITKELLKSASNE